MSAAPLPSAVAVQSDGRVARGERTRRALAEAMISLLEEGHHNPTGRLIAERAGVSLRLVFHHFDDLEAILRASVAVQGERHWWRIQPVEVSNPLSKRVRIIVRQRADLYESIASVRRVALGMERRSPSVAAELERSRKILRDHLQATFAAELAGCSGAARRRLVDALDAATSFENWEGLRLSGRSDADARRAIELLVESALAPLTHADTTKGTRR
jgi:TetR/AcrR family transcriptional regulator of autoinduction and epiphytic fitness